MGRFFRTRYIPTVGIIKMRLKKMCIRDSLILRRGPHPLPLYHRRHLCGGRRALLPPRQRPLLCEGGLFLGRAHLGAGLRFRGAALLLLRVLPLLCGLLLRGDVYKRQLHLRVRSMEQRQVSWLALQPQTRLLSLTANGITSSSTLTVEVRLRRIFTGLPYYAAGRPHRVRSI